jgi:hypothetical protein
MMKSTLLLTGIVIMLVVFHSRDEEHSSQILNPKIKHDSLFFAPDRGVSVTAGNQFENNLLLPANPGYIQKYSSDIPICCFSNSQ